MTSLAVKEIRPILREISVDAEAYFAATRSHLANRKDPADVYSPHEDYYWNLQSDELREAAKSLVEKALPACAALAEVTRTSPLTGAEDQQDVKIATKALRSAIYLRRYYFSEPQAIHDDGVVLGFRPAEQHMGSGLTANEAEAEFFDQLSTIASILRLVEAAPGGSSTIGVTSPDTARYRAGTAFIMMWMDPEHPELTDVADTVRTVFRTFDVRAVRADDIEHEGLISERVLNEIRTAEFLFADLTGTRPNVYYEVGYAHALGKRVILFRKTGTGVHFDLAGYNCPEYENLRDLREKLTKRLVSLTNRNPGAGSSSESEGDSS